MVDYSNFDYIKLGDNLKKLRKSKGLNQSKISEIIEVSYQQYQKFEKGKNSISISQLLKICDEFQVSIDDIIK